MWLLPQHEPEFFLVHIPLQALWSIVDRM